jgi:hypothetical protein
MGISGRPREANFLFIDVRCVLMLASDIDVTDSAVEE